MQGADGQFLTGTFIYYILNDIYLSLILVFELIKNGDLYNNNLSFFKPYRGKPMIAFYRV